MDTVAAHFERLYRSREDPWGLRAHWYERRKRELLLATLSRDRYAHAFEPGCGEGDLTLRLAQRCDRVCAVDLSHTAILRCQARIAASGLPGVRALKRDLPARWPARTERGFDLAVISEFGYYLRREDLSRFLDALARSLRPGAEVVACHWRGDFSDRLLATDAVHEAIGRLPGLRPLASHRETEFRLDSWRGEAPQEGGDDDRNLHSRP
ncbi:class I SAM-dependent methyltransferase [Achromobacter denitrificans]|uniref:Methyltransferase domain-containing protein n=1 Tax=Achromobacter denitrificans TaxID=32002 RepID=A0A6N0JJD9_ACHDE|nr:MULTISPECIES: class I SAM-dependent methyltransferase [Achromobacter]MBV2159013.1 methyltransferase domain-containing protein [Achromobacter denitrificans]MDF3847927.1 methyltransferase domain-containing protein [Achromobacter denitrificans]MDF3860257.1 methyltransferase domain-containing protein [Achromobacter denitrificans]MDF3940182.1 methyltransferase domain-containing protein [Achromobacter denitrificans]MDX3880933.1 methyltransferase domain-containing protein [Achromobacter sp.]